MREWQGKGKTTRFGNFEHVDACDADGARATDGVASTTRQTCPRCGRPVTCCLCEYLPSQPFHTATEIFVIQHPEGRRKRAMHPAIAVRVGTLLHSRRMTGRRIALFIQRRRLHTCIVLLYPADDAIALDESGNAAASWTATCQRPSIAFSGRRRHVATRRQICASSGSLMALPKVALRSESADRIYVTLRTEPKATMLDARRHWPRARAHRG